MKRLLAPIAIVALAGCAGPAGMLINADLSGASAMAQANGDKEAVACFDALQKANTGSVVGFFGALEQFRIFRQAKPFCANVMLP